MKKRNIITICGINGSGKSTAAKGVALELGYSHFSAGDFMRAMASEKGITLAELGALAETDVVIDKEIDRRQKEYMDTHENFVIDSRLGWYFAPDSFRVFLSLDADTSAARVFADIMAKKSERANEVEGGVETVEGIKNKLADRFESERLRYKEYYGIENHFDLSHFDLVVDTKINGIEEVRKIILDGYKVWQNE